MKFQSDIDIDFADRQQILSVIPHRVATNRNHAAHNTGVYVTDIPVDPATGRASLDYETAEQRGYIKLDFLNVSVYNEVGTESRLLELMQRDPPWHRLLEKSFCEQLIHIGNHHDSIVRLPEPIDDIVKLAMFLAMIRPGKRELLGRTWDDVARTIWDRPSEGYYFKKAHAISYAHLVAVHMNLLDTRSADQGN